MFIPRKTLVFVVLSVLLAADFCQTYISLQFSPSESTLRTQGHSLLQQNSTRSEFSCVFTPRELQQHSGGEVGHWRVTESGLESLEGDIQSLVNCTEEGDVLLFDVEAHVQPSRRVIIPWNLTLSAFVESPRLENGTFPEARSKVTFLCPSEDEGVFLVEADEILFANFIFRNCSLNRRRGDEPYGIITTANCGTRQNSGTVAFHHLEFEANFLNRSAALYVREPSCSSIRITDVRFQNNSCIGTCAASLPTWSEMQSVSLTVNRFFEVDARTPILIRIHSESNTTIDGLIATGNNGTVVHVQNANLTIRNSHFFRNSVSEDQNRYSAAGVTLLHSSGQILDCRFEGNTGNVGSSIGVRNSSSVIVRTTVIGCNATRRGGGVAITMSSNASILHSVVANNSAELTGGGIYSNETRTMKIANTTIGTNSAAGGGGMYFSYGDLEITSSTFQSNNADRDGAGLYLGRGTITTRDSIFSNNRADRFGGGGFIIENLYSLTNLTLVQNNAVYGGGFSIAQSSGSLNNSYFAGNLVRSDGGGIHMSESNDSFVRSCTLANNSASYGGGIYGTRLMRASVLLCDFIQNRVSVSGGGANLRNGSYTLDGNCFEENTSGGHGGGLTGLHSTLSVSDTNFVNNSALTYGGANLLLGNVLSWFTNCNWTANIAGHRGGGARFTSGAAATITASAFSLNRAEHGAGAYATGANLTLHNTTWDHNVASRLGAAVYFIESNGTVSNCKFVRNNASYGGAVSVYNSETWITSSSFVSNRALNHGGAIWCSRSNALRLEGTSFVSNSANDSGGAIIVSSSSLLATTLRFQNNIASRFGGAVHSQGNTLAFFSHSRFYSESSGHLGGAISATETVLNMTNISIASCLAVHGGGVSLYDSLASIIDTRVIFCEASESGGGIRMLGSNLTSSGLNISHNRAIGTQRYRPQGGGIAMDTSSRLSVRNATLVGNQAEIGAGIRAQAESIVFVSDGYFNNNSATTSGGAGYFHYSSATMNRILCGRNRASSGGSFYVFNSSLTLNESQLMNSSSTDAGGSVFAHGNATVDMEGTTIQSSTSVNGGGIMLVDSYFLGVRVQFQNCSARQHGGGVGLNESSSFLCTECLLGGNNASLEGGALRLESLSLQLLAFQLENTIFRDNAAAFGGGIHFQSGDGSANCSNVNSAECTFLALTGCVFTNNQARFAGGAILANNPHAIRISCDTFNKADPFVYYTREESETLRGLSSLEVACDSWTENSATTYGPIIGSYARRVSASISLGPNKTLEIPSNRYIVHNHQSGVPLPIILLKAIDEFNQGPALIQGNQLIEAVMTSPDRLFAGVFIVRMEESQGNFSGITAFNQPKNYAIHINFSERAIPTLIIVVEIRHCIIGESRAANGTLCEPCGDSTYNFLPQTNEECTPCPDNANCESVAIRPKKGFWHQTPCSTHIQRCLSERACDEEERNTRLLELGSSIEDCDFDDEFVSNYSEALCREGYTGPLCGSCKASHGKTRSFRCEECYGRLITVCLVVLAALVLLGLSAFTIRGALPAHKHSASRRQSRREESSTSSPVNIQMAEMLWTGIVPREMIYPHLRRQEDRANTSAARQQRQRNAELAKWKATEIFKITINYLQVIAIAIAVNVAWTGALIALFETAEFIGGVTSDAAGRSTVCLVSAGSSIPRSAVNTIVNLSIPAVVTAFFVLFWTVIMIRKKKGYRYLAKRCLLSLLVVSYLSYIAVTKTAVNTLYCVRVHDFVDLQNDSTTKYWAVDTSLKCYDGPHTLLASVCGWPTLALFSLGFPAVVAYMLITKSSKDGVQRSWLDETAGFLYRCYDKKFIFWESVILLRKAALAVIVVFAYPLGGNLQGILAVCVLMTALYLHLRYSPYRSELEVLNRLEGLSLFISSSTFVSGLFLNDEHTSSESRTTVGAFIVFANVVVFIYFVVRFFVASATYLGIFLENEEVDFDKNGTAFYIMKTFLKNRFEARLEPVLKHLCAFAYRNNEECTSDEV